MYLRKRLCLLTAGMAVMLCGCTSYQFKDNIANANETETYTYVEDGEKESSETIITDITVSRDIDENVEAVTKSYDITPIQDNAESHGTSAIIDIKADKPLSYPAGGYTIQNSYLSNAYAALNSNLGKSLGNGSLMEEAGMYAANMAATGQIMSTKDAGYKLYSGQGSSVSADKVVAVINNICNRFSFDSCNDVSIGIANSDAGELFIAVVVK